MIREEFHWILHQGQRIAAMAHIPEGNGPHPAVMMLHGFTGDKVESHYLFVKTARALAQAGFVALRFDFRGSGESEGRFQDVTIPGEIEDALTVLSWLAEQPYVDVDRLGVLGLSMGGCVAAHVAGADPRIKALVLWAAVADPLGLFNELAETTPTAPPWAGKRTAPSTWAASSWGRISSSPWPRPSPWPRWPTTQAPR